MGLPANWTRAIGLDPLESPEFADLRAFLDAEEAEHPVYPPPSERFAAFEHTPFADVRVVVLGQDPYHGPGQAHGLSFSVKRPTRVPPSLRNIYKELGTDLEFDPPSHGELTAWAKQGVLLLNTVLTVRHKKAGSHRKKGWERFTDRVIDTLSARQRPMVFLLWGKSAQAKAERIADHHAVFQAPHPSPYSAHTGFFGCRHFSRTNGFLVDNGLSPIDWQLD